MKKGISIAILFVLSACLTPSLRAQTDAIGDFLRAGADDAEALTRAYLQPLPSGMGSSLNSGWFNEAAPKKTLRFSIQLRSGLAFVPDADQRFNINKVSLQKTSVADGASPITPTLAGESTPGSEIVVRENGEEITRFNLPEGSGLQFVPAPTVQASVGLIRNTDVTLRFIPTVSISDYGEFNMLGGGLRHSLSQYIPLFPLDVSVFAGFSRLNIKADLDLDPQSDLPADPTVDYDNQELSTQFNAFTGKLIVGKSLPFVRLFAAGGYQTATMDVDLTGNYPIEVPTGIPGQTRTQTLTDPFSYSQHGEHAFTLTGGATLKLFFFDLFGQYTLADYNTLNAGLGFSF